VTELQPHLRGGVGLAGQPDLGLLVRRLQADQDIDPGGAERHQIPEQVPAAGRMRHGGEPTRHRPDH
jgi:hypothetical protein